LGEHLNCNADDGPLAVLGEEILSYVLAKYRNSQQIAVLTTQPQLPSSRSYRTAS
jgi:hypothetical protein